ncbi:MAG TPA: hypothetical protein VGP86_15000, partial [Xanthobacteraceae bacterium]|nr:hypothetical protein [Xanthobacteraceae bacterium]
PRTEERFSRRAVEFKEGAGAAPHKFRRHKLWRRLQSLIYFIKNQVGIVWRNNDPAEGAELAPLYKDSIIIKNPIEKMPTCPG